MFSFKLKQEFIANYTDRQPNWGYQDAAGNSLGEITFLRTYSRIKPDGTKEKWYEVCQRVIEGMYSIQKDHAKSNRLPWSDSKAQASAQEAYERMFEFKWTPPGRGLWVMGTPLVMEQKNSAPLQNCAFVSTGDMTKANPSEPFVFMMEALMLGVGVGFDLKGAEKGFTIQEPTKLRDDEYVHTIPDTREGWVESVGIVIDAYLKKGAALPEFDYSQIRAKGEPIKTFGGTAAGPDPLREIHERIAALFVDRQGDKLTSIDILDIGNLIGVCVVAGNVRRSAELALGDIQDEAFLDAKNPEAYPERNSYDPEAPGWGWMSNNSVTVKVGDDLSAIAEGIARNGEPGVVWMDVSRQYGRLADEPNNKDWRVMGYNPCFHPDTIVETVNGPKKISEINEPTMVYTKGPDGKLTTRKASAAFQTKKNAETVRVRLQNGDELIVTPDHKLMRRDGSWVEAGQLQPGDSLEVLSRVRRGWRYSGVRLSSQKPSEQVMEHRLVWEGVYGEIPVGFDIDHINRDHHDNAVDNLRMLSHSEHAKLSRSQVPNNHQVHGPNGDFAPSGNHGKKPLAGKVDPPRATGWTNQHTVVSVEPGPVTDVWDITVEETHCLIANGVVAHNCAEQSLESYEMCTLVETYIGNHDSLEDFERTLKFAYLYAKTVTLLPTHWERTNAIMQRNRRIGTSISGLADFADNHGMAELRRYLNHGYETVQRYDDVYSEWLGIRQSVKTTTVKPSGTVSILAGESPGVHWSPGGRYFERRIRFAIDDPMVKGFMAAGYLVEPASESPDSTVVVAFPIQSKAARAEKDVTIFEKIHLAAELQRYWSDNSVSVTVSFDPETEGQHVGSVLSMYDGKLKTVSFLPMAKGTYPQMPYTEIEESDYAESIGTLQEIDWTVVYAGEAKEAEGEAFCTTDACEITTIKNTMEAK